MLTRVRSAVTEVAMSRKRLVLQAGQLEQQIDKVGDRSRKAMEVAGATWQRRQGTPGRCPGAASCATSTPTCRRRKSAFPCSPPRSITTAAIAAPVDGEKDAG